MIIFELSLYIFILSAHLDKTNMKQIFSPIIDSSFQPENNLLYFDKVFILEPP